MDSRRALNRAVLAIEEIECAPAAMRLRVMGLAVSKVDDLLAAMDTGWEFLGQNPEHDAAFERFVQMVMAYEKLTDLGVEPRTHRFIGS